MPQIVELLGHAILERERILTDTRAARGGGSVSETPAPDRAAQLREQRRHNRLLAEQMRGRRLERQQQLLEAQLAYDWVQPYSDLLDRLRNGEQKIAGPTAVWNRRYGRVTRSSSPSRN